MLTRSRTEKCEVNGNSFVEVMTITRDAKMIGRKSFAEEQCSLSVRDIYATSSIVFYK